MTTRVTTFGKKSDSLSDSFAVALPFTDLGALSSALPRYAPTVEASGEDRPPYAVRCAKKVNSALFPRIQPAANFEAKGLHYQCGFGLGLMEAGFRSMGDVFDRLGPLKQTREPTEEEIRKGCQNLFCDAGDEIFEIIKDDGVKFQAAIDDFESKMTLGESAEYAQGKADALSMLAGKNKANDATEIYLFMALFWRLVDRLRSVDELYELLAKVFGRNRVGYDPKRVAQICQRVGKKFRSRGRPRKQPHAIRQVR